MIPIHGSWGTESYEIIKYSGWKLRISLFLKWDSNARTYITLLSPTTYLDFVFLEHSHLSYYTLKIFFLKSFPNNFFIQFLSTNNIERCRDQEYQKNKIKPRMLKGIEINKTYWYIPLINFFDSQKLSKSTFSLLSFSPYFSNGISWLGRYICCHRKIQIF